MSNFKHTTKVFPFQYDFHDIVSWYYLMIGKILGFWLVNCHMIWSCINLSESCINLPVFVCMYACSFLLPMQRSRRQSWDKFVINCFGVWYNLYLAIRGLYHPRLRLGWYSPLIARYKLYHTPKQLITNSIIVCLTWPFIAGGEFGHYKMMQKNMKNYWNPGEWVLIWEYSARAIQWIPTWQGLGVFHKSLHPCILDDSSLNIERVKWMNTCLWLLSQWIVVSLER